MDKYYSVKEAADLLSVSTNTLYSYLQNGKIKAKRIGNGRFRIPADQIEGFAAKNKSIGKTATYLRYAVFSFVMIGIGLAVGASGTYFFVKSAAPRPNVAGVSTVVAEVRQPAPVATVVPTPTPIPLTSYRMALLNGTETVGATRYTESVLVASGMPVEITARAMAVRRDYPETVLIDLFGNRGDDVMRLSQLLNIPVSILPEGELVPESTDFLIIVGQR